MGETSYATNLASEFYVMSVLCRLQLEAHLTLGNKKAVDIAVIGGAGKALTLDVKGVAKKHSWLVGRQPPKPRTDHFVVLVAYDGQLRSPQVLPRCWIVPHREFLPLVSRSGNGSASYVLRSRLRQKGAEFEEAWHLLGAEVTR